jgi:hypothetical protein
MLEENDSPSSSRELVVLECTERQTHLRRSVHGVSPFVAQLIANVRGLPQARVRRRAEPDEVIAAYRSTIERIQQLNVKS